MEEALKDPKVKSDLEKSRAIKQRRIEEKSTELPAKNDDKKSFALSWHQHTAHTALKPTNYDIVNSWILDSGSNIHVCNDSTRFTPTRQATAEDYLISGSTTYPIQAYGTVDIIVTSPVGKKESITLREVALIPGFFTNLVSYSRAKTAKIYWDPIEDTLFTVNKDRKDHFCKLQPHNGHWIVEYNAQPAIPVPEFVSAPALSTKSTESTPARDSEPIGPLPSAAASQQKTVEMTPNHLHRVMGHAGPEAISRMLEATEGIRLTSLCDQHQFDSCQVYRQSKAHKVISRDSGNEVEATRPLQRISYDLIPIEEGYNGDTWISHFVCQTTHFHWLWTHRNKY